MVSKPRKARDLIIETCTAHNVWVFIFSTSQKQQHTEDFLLADSSTSKNMIYKYTRRMADTLFHCVSL